MSEVIESVELRFQEGSSDKVYMASIMRSASGCVVDFAFGRRGTALNTGTKTPSPLPYAEAATVYRKLVQSKTAKGYRVFTGSGTHVIAVAHDAGRDTGLRPQLLNPIDEGEAAAFVTNSCWCVQEKYDGRRLLVRRAADGTLTAANRTGRAVACPEPVATVLSGIRGPFTVDGELVSDRLHVFDLLESNDGDQRLIVYGERLSALESLLGHVSGAVEVAPTVFGTSAKRAFVDSLRSAGKEGAVFKDLYATWTEGKASSGGPSHKLKFWETCSCVVLRTNTGRRSVEVALDGLAVGSVTIPPNAEVPEPGQVVEIRYLYVAAVGGSLYQPVYLGVRDDIEPGECTAEAQRLKYKAAA